MIDFPAAPVLNQLFPAPSGVTYKCTSIAPIVWTSMATQTSVPEAPIDGLYYARKDAAWAENAPFVEAPTDNLYYARRNTQWVAMTKAGAGLDQVDNTSDINKPVSTAQAAAFVDATGDTMTGPLRLGDGTLVAPSLSWSAETGMGFYRPAANQIGVAKGGLLRYLFDATSAAGSIFTIKADPAGTGGALLITDFAGNNQGGIYSRRAGSPRWTLLMGDGSAESGGSNGSHFSIWRHDNAGTSIDMPFFINRETGYISLSPTIFVGNATAGSQIQMAGPAANGKDILGISAGTARWNLRVGSGTGDGGDDFVVYRYNDAGVIQSPYAMRIYRNNGGSIFSTTVQIGINSTGMLGGGGTSSELAIAPAVGAQAGITWPNTNGGYIAVRGNANSNYSVGAITCYSGSGNTGVSLTPGATAWSTTSDIREKNVDSTIEGGLDAVMAMEPIRYRYIFEDASAPLRVGLSAQSVVTHIPEAVTEVPKLGADGEPTGETRLNLALAEVVPHMVAAIKEINNRLKALEQPA